MYILKYVYVHVYSIHMSTEEFSLSKKKDLLFLFYFMKSSSYVLVIHFCWDIIKKIEIVWGFASLFYLSLTVKVL